jgi:hypothetical protein
MKIDLLRPTRPPLHLRPTPAEPDNFTIFHRDHVRFLRRILFSRGRSNEGSRAAEREAEQNDRNLGQQVHELGLSPVFQAEASLKRRK